MSSTIESILAQVKQLPAAERERLIAELTKDREAEPAPPPSKMTGANAPFIDRTLEYEWLAQQQHEYLGQWVALKGDLLIAHSYNAKEVFEKAREMGINDALIFLVSGPAATFLDPQVEIPPSRIIKTNVPFDDRRLEYEWLAQHQREYIGQWVALKGNQLIAHSYDAKEVFAKAREFNVQDAFVLLVEDPDIPFVGV
jgi:hypothetical protein